MNPPQDISATHLLEALEADQFLLYCQPIVPLRPGQADRRYLEVLIRLLEEEQKLLPPGTFLPVLQQAGLMPLLDRWVIREVFKWIASGSGGASPSSPPLPAPAPVTHCSINLSATTMRDRRMASFIRHQLAEHGVMPDRVSFELPMSQIRHDRAAFVQLAAWFQPLGCPLSVSGFAGNVTALPALRRLGVRVIKIDGGLVRTLGRKPAALEKLKGITDACIGLGLLSVAEMVEEPEAIVLLREAGVDYAQGYGLGLPIPLAQLG